MYRLNLALPETPSKPSALDTLKQQEPKTLWGPMQPLEAVGAAAVVEGAGMPAVIGTRKDRFLLRTTLSPGHSRKSSYKSTTVKKKPESTAWRRPNRTAKLSKPTAPEYSPRVPPPAGAREVADSAAPTTPAKATGSQNQERQSSLGLGFQGLGCFKG